MRAILFLVVILAALPVLPTLAASAPDDEVRLRILEKQVADLEDDRRDLRAHADKVAKGEADSAREDGKTRIDAVEKIAAAQVQALKDILTYVLALLALVAALGGYATIRKVRHDAEQEMKAFMKSLETKEASLLATLQERADSLIVEIEATRDDAHELHRQVAADAEQTQNKLRDLISAGNVAMTPEEMDKARSLNADGKPPAEHSPDDLILLYQAAMTRGSVAEAARHAAALVDRWPDDARALVLLSRVRLSQGLSGEALDIARRAVTAARQVGDRAIESVALADMGDAMGLIGDGSGAARAYRDSLVIAEAVLAETPNDPWRQFQVAVAHSRIGTVLLDIGDTTGAQREFESFHDIMAALVARDPGNAGWRRELAASWRDYARAALASGRDAEVADLLTRAESVLTALRGRDPNRPLYRQDLAWLDALRGDLAGLTNDDATARRHWQAAVKEWEELERAGTLNWFGRRELRDYRRKLGQD